MKKKIIVLSLTILFAFTMNAENRIALPDLVNPGSIVVEKNLLYVAEYEKIFVFDLNTFKRLVMFGKKGDGPGEFNLGLRSRKDALTITPLGKTLAVSSRNKIAFFTADGQFVNEKKMTYGLTRKIQPIKDFFVSRQFRGMRESKPYQSITLFDSDLKKIREIYKLTLKIELRQNQGSNVGTINEFDDVFGYALGKEEIYVFDTQEFNIKILDINSNIIGTIKIDYQPVKLTSKVKKNFMEYYKNVSYKDSWDHVKNRIKLPKYFPAIHSIHVSGGKLYIQTYKKENGKVEFYRFDSSHNLKKTLLLPLAEASVREFYPYCIHHSILYQIVESEGEEQWFLLIHRFD